jgi:AcrR family transcriptional regulator
MPRPRTDIRPRIIEAARERFAAAGVDATSLRSIASDAGTSIGMIYYYFPTKDDLFLAVVEDVYGQLLAELERELARDGGFRENVLALYRRIGSASPLELQVIRLVAREAFTSGQRLERVALRFGGGHVPLIVDTVLGGVSSGELRGDLHPIVLVAATIALGTLPQIALRLLRKHLPATAPDASELTQQLCAVLIEGAGSRH